MQGLRSEVTGSWRTVLLDCVTDKANKLDGQVPVEGDAEGVGKPRHWFIPLDSLWLWAVLEFKQI